MVGLDVADRPGQMHPAAQRAIDDKQVVGRSADLTDGEGELDLDDGQPLLQCERELIEAQSRGVSGLVGRRPGDDVRGLRRGREQSAFNRPSTTPRSAVARDDPGCQRRGDPEGRLPTHCRAPTLARRSGGPRRGTRRGLAMRDGGQGRSDASPQRVPPDRAPARPLTPSESRHPGRRRTRARRRDPTDRP